MRIIVADQIEDGELTRFTAVMLDCSQQGKVQHSILLSTSETRRASTMSYEEETLMETFDKWDNRDRRERFVRRMEHKLRSKERKYR